MPVTADTNLVALRAGVEVTYGDPTSVAAWQEMRYTSSGLIHNKNTVQPETITADRGRGAPIEVAASAEGDLGFELAYGADLEMLLKAVLHMDAAGGAFTSNTASGTFDIDKTGAASKKANIDRSSGSFVTDGVKANSYAKLGGFNAAANDKAFFVESVSALQVVVLDPDDELTDVTGDADESIVQKYGRNGKTKRSLTLEHHFSDVDEYIHYRGMRANELALTVSSEQIVTGTLSFQGLEGLSGQQAGGETNAPTTLPLNATANVKNLFEGSGLAELTNGVRSLNMSLGNNVRTKRQIAAKFPFDIGLGFFDATGSMEVYFEDVTLLNKFLNHTESGISWKFEDNAGNFIGITLPRVFFTSGSPPVPGGNEDVIQTIEFGAAKHADGYVVNIDLLDT